jgi:hypothetical protein
VSLFFFSCVRTLLAASVQAVILMCTCSFLGTHLPVDRPGIDISCVNQGDRKL